MFFPKVYDHLSGPSQYSSSLLRVKSRRDFENMGRINRTQLQCLFFSPNSDSFFLTSSFKSELAV